jgi:hypothetical protein
VSKISKIPNEQTTDIHQATCIPAVTSALFNARPTETEGHELASMVQMIYPEFPNLPEGTAPFGGQRKKKECEAKKLRPGELLPRRHLSGMAKTNGMENCLA